MFDEIIEKAASYHKTKEAEQEFDFTVRYATTSPRKKALLISTKTQSTLIGDKWARTFISKDMLESHIDLNHINDQEHQGVSQLEKGDSIADLKECSLCEYEVSRL